MAATSEVASSNVEALRTRLGVLSGFNPDVRAPRQNVVGDVVIGRVGGLTIARVTHNAVEMVRGAPPADVPSSRKVLMVIQLSNSRSVLIQDGVDAELRLGDIALVDSDRPFSARFHGMTTQILAYLPTEEVFASGRSERIRKLFVHSDKDPLVSLVRPMLSSLIANEAQLDGADGSYARRALLELGRGLVAKQRVAPAPPADPLPCLRVREFIEANLSHPQLSPAAIARGCGISVRRLHRMFADTRWTVCEWMRDQRLKNCNDDLCDSGSLQRSITEIAFRWGFNDSAHFSRVFRQHFGKSPSEARQMALAQVGTIVLAQDFVAH